METAKQNKEIRRELHTAAAGLHVRESATGEASRTIAGYAILFNVESAPLWSDDDTEAREVITPEAVTKELLDGSDIKFTMFHDRQLILSRSNNGSGTLSYNIDDKGVSFEFEAPHTADGDKALELVKRGDISGCSFMFTTRYWDEAFVERTARSIGSRTVIVYRVKTITGIYDFTLAADPAYPATSVEAREFADSLRDENTENDRERSERVAKQVREMRAAVNRKLSI